MLPALGGNSALSPSKDVFNVNGTGSRRGRKSSLIQSSIDKPNINQTMISSSQNYGSGPGK